MQYVVNTRSSGLNVRSGPGLNFPVLRNLRRGTVVEVSREQGDWCWLSTGGWVHEDYLREATSVVLSDDELLRKSVVELLRDPVLARINFRYGSFQLRGSSFAHIARAIEAGRIDVRYEDLDTSRAEYDFESNVLAVQKNEDPGNFITRGFIVHEVAHAIQDSQRRRITGSETEAAGFIAQYCYYLLKRPRLQNAPLSNDSAGAAMTIARRVVTASSPYAVTSAELQMLRERLLQGGGYSAAELSAIRFTNGF